MSTISRSTTWSDGQTLTAAALNGEFNVVFNDYNGSITNANISGSAAIATSKISATFPSGTIVGTTDTQTLTNKTIGGTQITDATITNRKIKLDEIQSVTSTTNVNSNSTSYSDYTGLSVTFTPNVASNFLVLFQTTSYNNQAAGGQSSFIIDLDGATQGNDPLVTFVMQDNVAGNFDVSMSGFVWITGVSAASHTVKARFKSITGTLNTRYGALIVIPFAS